MHACALSAGLTVNPEASLLLPPLPRPPAGPGELHASGLAGAVGGSVEAATGDANLTKGNHYAESKQ